MTSDKFFNRFQEDLQKLVRDYIFTIDSLKDDDDLSKRFFTKKENYLQIFDYKETEHDVIVTYQIFQTSPNNISLEKPVTTTISKFHLLAVSYFKN